MDARELTKVVNDHANRIIELEKDNRYLNDEIKKLRLLVDDLKIEVQMMNKPRG